MLPFLDMENHRSGAPVDWAAASEANGRAVVFTASRDGGGVAPHAEVFINYGAKSNEELLMIHGFCFADNVNDTYGLKLSSSAEPLYIHRHDSPTDPQFPPALWRALGGSADGKDDGDGDGAAAAAAAGVENDAADDDDDEGDEDAPPQIEVDAEAVEFLLLELAKRCKAFDATDERDRASAASNDERAVAVAYYRIGQRTVLRQAIAALREMLGEETDER